MILPRRLPRSSFPSSAFVLALIVAAAGMTSAVRTQQEGVAGDGAVEPTETTERVETVHVVVATSAPLAPIDLEVSEAGLPAEVVAVEAAGPWQVVFYFDTAVSDGAAVRRIASRLSERLEELVEVGTVELVIADPEPGSVLPPTRDLSLLGPALDRLGLEVAAEDAVRQRRRALLDALRPPPPAAVPGADPAPPPLDLARSALEDEIAMRRAQHDALLAWLAERGPSDDPRALFLASDVLADDPLDFYVPRVPGGAQLALDAARLPEGEELAEVAAAFGWQLFPIADAPEDEERDRALQYRPSADLPVGFRLGLGRDRQPDETEAEPDVGLEQSTPERLERLAELARTTGAERVAIADLTAAVLALAERRTVTYRPPERLADARPPFGLEVLRSNSGAALLARNLSYHGLLPEAISALRVRRALAGELAGEELEVEALMEFDGGTLGREPASLLVESDVEAEGALRVTVGLALDDRPPVVRSERIERPSPPAEGELWQYRTEVMLPSGTEATVVLVEDLANDRWGIGFAEMIDRRFGDVEPRTPSAEQLAGERALRLSPEDPDVRRGRAVFVVDAREIVERVVFLLDGEPVAERNRRPFRARVDLGNAPRFREVSAIGYDADGFEVDRDKLLINEPADAFWVRITEPRPGRQVGPVAVTVELKIPDSGELDRVELYWGDEREATLRQPPWQGRVRIPVDRPEGYIRAEAHLGDGRVAEDVVLMNRPGFGTEIGVELVELYVVVTDRDEEPVSGLPRDAFRVLEDGIEQEIETVAAAGDLPLTVGLAIDTSSSLFVKMPAVRRAARSFARSLVSDRDRAFLMEFGSQPRLVQPTTGNLRRVVDGIDSLEPYGTTPVWEAVALSLEQLAASPGRKALVVFYDGDDEDEDFSFRRTLRLARELRVPVYLIVMNNEAARTQGRSFSTRAFVQRLERTAKAGGGRVFFVTTEADLTPIYQSISDELRSHYLITYYPKSEAGGPQWREVTVEVDRPGLEARTIEGYGEPRP